MTTAIEFWFDPTCPFTWRTSRWARELERVGEATIEWKVMSLGILNEGREIPEQYREGMVRGTRFLRALVAASELGGSDAVGRLYDALGTHLHDDGEELADDVLLRSVVGRRPRRLRRRRRGRREPRRGGSGQPRGGPAPRRHGVGQPDHGLRRWARLLRPGRRARAHRRRRVDPPQRDDLAQQGRGLQRAQAVPEPALTSAHPTP